MPLPSRIKNSTISIASPREPVGYVLCKVDGIVILAYVQRLSPTGRRISDHNNTSAAKNQSCEHDGIIAHQSYSNDRSGLMRK